MTQFCIHSLYNMRQFCTHSLWNMRQFCTHSLWNKRQFCTHSLWNMRQFCTHSLWNMRQFCTHSLWNMKFSVVSTYMYMSYATKHLNVHLVMKLLIKTYWWLIEKFNMYLLKKLFYLCVNKLRKKRHIALINWLGAFKTEPGMKVKYIKNHINISCSVENWYMVHS